MRSLLGSDFNSTDPGFIWGSKMWINNHTYHNDKIKLDFLKEKGTKLFPYPLLCANYLLAYRKKQPERNIAVHPGWNAILLRPKTRPVSYRVNAF